MNEDEDDETYMYIDQLFIGKIEPSKWQVNLRIQSEEILFKLYTGAQANVLPYYIFQEVGRDDELKNTGVVCFECLW